MINDLSTRSCSQKALKVAHFSKPSPSDTANKSRTVDQLAKTRQVALVTIQAAPTGTISIFSPLLPSTSIHVNKKSNLSFKYSRVPFSLGEVRSIVE